MITAVMVHSGVEYSRVENSRLARIAQAEKLLAEKEKERKAIAEKKQETERKRIEKEKRDAEREFSDFLGKGEGLFSTR